MVYSFRKFIVSTLKFKESDMKTIAERAVETWKVKIDIPFFKKGETVVTFDGVTEKYQEGYSCRFQPKLYPDVFELVPPLDDCRAGDVLTMEDIKRTKKLCEENSSTHQESMQDLEKLIDLHKEYQKEKVPYSPSFWGGQCGKCGAPYFYENGFNDFPRPVPTCACWNLLKTITTNGTGEIK